MKKIKLIAPILGTIGAASALAPLVTLTSCSKNNTNAVYLASGQTADRTISKSTNRITYKFVQKNINQPESTKLSLSSFKVNGVEHDVWAKTFSYRTDSAGNILVHINIDNIINSMSDISSMSFDLLFKNKKAGSEHLVGSFNITFEEEEPVDIAVSDNAKASTLKTINTSTSYKIESTDSTNKYIKSIEVTDSQTNESLKEGIDYTKQLLYDKNAGKDYLIFTTLTDKDFNVNVTTQSNRSDTYLKLRYVTDSDAEDYEEFAYSNGIIPFYFFYDYGWSFDLAFYDENDEKVEITTETAEYYSFSFRYADQSEWANRSLDWYNTGSASAYYVNGYNLEDSPVGHDQVIIKWNYRPEDTTKAAEGSLLCEVNCVGGPEEGEDEPIKKEPIENLPVKEPIEEEMNEGE